MNNDFKSHFIKISRNINSGNFTFLIPLHFYSKNVCACLEKYNYSMNLSLNYLPNCTK